MTDEMIEIVEVEEDDFDLLDFDAVEEVKEKTKKEVAKKEVKKEEPAKKETKEAAKPKTFKYPFTLHYAGRNIDVTHIFEENKEYSASEITQAMLNHQFYEFSGKVDYDYIESDNVLVPIFQQHKKG